MFNFIILPKVKLGFNILRVKILILYFTPASYIVNIQIVAHGPAGYVISIFRKYQNYLISNYFIYILPAIRYYNVRLQEEYLN